MDQNNLGDVCNIFRIKSLTQNQRNPWFYNSIQDIKTNFSNSQIQDNL